MVPTLIDGFGCLWCGRDLPDPDQLFCGESCRVTWLSDEA